MVYLGSDTMASEEGVYGEGKVEGSTSRRHSLYFALRSEDEYLRRKEIEFDGIEEIHCVGLWVVENLLDSV